MARADNENAVRKAKQDARDAERNRLVILERLCADALGRAFLWNLIADAHVFAQTVDFGPAGHGVMCFAEGERAMGLKLFNLIIKHFPQAYLAMTKENAAVKLEEEDENE